MTEQDAAGQARCSMCSAPMRWVLTEGNRRMPLDAEPNPAGNVLLIERDGKVRARVLGGPDLPVRDDLTAWMPHFNTCPDSAEFKRRKHAAAPRCKACRDSMGRHADFLIEHHGGYHVNCAPPLDIREAVRLAREALPERRTA